MAGKVYRLGDTPGLGSSVKMINQLLAGVHIVSAAHQQFLAAAGAGLGRADDSAVVRVYEQLTGVNIPAAARESGGGA